MSRVSGCMDSLFRSCRRDPAPEGRQSQMAARAAQQQGGHKLDGVHMSERNVSGASHCVVGDVSYVSLHFWVQTTMRSSGRTSHSRHRNARGADDSAHRHRIWSWNASMGLIVPSSH
jgi:hypothetical protein